jgi:aspartyl-tRNA synthetase
VTHPEFARVSCGALSANDVDKDVELSGWVHRRRDHGGLIFIDLRDRDGITQITFDPADAATFKTAETLRSEFVVRVHGRVRLRPEGTVNPKLVTGAVEVPVKTLEILNKS